MHPCIRYCLATALLASLLLNASTAFSAEEEDIAYWPYFSYPPLFVLEDDHPPAGFGIWIQDMLMTQLPEYRHVRLEASPERLFDDVSQGRHYVLVGAIRTPERERTMLFSLPCRVAFIDHIVLAASVLDRIGERDSVSLRTLLDEQDLVFGRLLGASYGKEIDDILAEYEGRPNIVTISGADGMDRLIRMVRSHRVDFILADPAFLAYYDDPSQEYDLKIILAEEQKLLADIGYVVVPKNEWGQAILERINTILAREIRSGHLREILLQYVPVSLHDRFDTFFKQNITVLLEQ